ncbi:F0F1 ATP synthase subunit A [Paenibacillus terrigena]|uniref:F0F1 ATP synthase subunit A n=1 Tax=Paenibacillus terrigena TaxID=369333 RepID=UPI0028D48A38|nr:F0F1 ATP synthase subunit A [Paenibacillus terrigena]
MHEAPIINVGGFNIDISIVTMLIVTCVVVFILARLAVRNLSVENPGKLQNFMEWAVEFVQGMISSTMDFKKGKVFVSLGMTLMMFILVGNLLGLPFGIVTEYSEPGHKIFGHEITTVNAAAFETLHEKKPDVEHPHIGVAWWKSPTADVNVTMGLAFLIFCIVHFLGMTRNTKAYFKSYIEPFPVFFPIKFIEVFSNLLTHGMRLYGNIFAGEVLISVLLGAGVFGIPGLIIWQGFSIFVGCIQAFVFTMLTMVYISHAVEDHSAEH